MKKTGMEDETRGCQPACGCAFMLLLIAVVLSLAALEDPESRQRRIDALRLERQRQSFDDSNWQDGRDMPKWWWEQRATLYTCDTQAEADLLLTLANDGKTWGSPEVHGVRAIAGDSPRTVYVKCINTDAGHFLRNRFRAATGWPDVDKWPGGKGFDVAPDR